MSNPEPPTVVVPPLLRGAMTDLLNCLCSTIATQGSGPVCWCGMYPGVLVSMEFCSECDNGADSACGMLYVRPDVAFPYNTFPAPSVDPTCQAGIAYRFEIGIARCMPTMESDGSLPGPDTLTEVGLNILADQWAIHSAIRCCDWQHSIANTGNKPLIAIDQWRPTGGGNCVGGHWGIYLDPNG